MPRCTTRLHGQIWTIRRRSTISIHKRSFASSSSHLGKAPDELLGLKELSEETHHRLAEQWVEGFVLDDIPKRSYETTYARSSGPGGQHVNTTSSKAVIRLALQPALGSWLPRYIMPQLLRSPHYVASPPSLLVSSQVSRAASSNAISAMKVLHATLLHAAKAPIIGETSEEQKERVKGFMAAEKATKRLIKDKQKMTKAGRRGEW